MKRLFTLSILSLLTVGCSTFGRFQSAANVAAGNDPNSTLGPIAQAVVGKVTADFQRTLEMGEAKGEPVITACGRDGLAAIATLPTDVGQPSGVVSSAALFRLFDLALHGPEMKKAEDSCAPLGVSLLQVLSRH